MVLTTFCLHFHIYLRLRNRNIRQSADHREVCIERPSVACVLVDCIDCRPVLMAQPAVADVVNVAAVKIHCLDRSVAMDIYN